MQRGRVPEPLGHLAGDVGKPALARLGAGGFSPKTPLHESGSFLLITFIVEGVAGGPGEEHRCMFELISSRPCHDPFVPIAPSLPLDVSS